MFSDEFAYGRDKISGNLHDGVVRFGEGCFIFGHRFLRRLLFVVREDAPNSIFVPPSGKFTFTHIASCHRLPDRDSGTVASRAVFARRCEYILNFSFVNAMLKDVGLASGRIEIEANNHYQPNIRLTWNGRAGVDVYLAHSPQAQHPDLETRPDGYYY